MAKKKRKQAGRPSKYKSQYAKNLIKFFDVEPFEDMALPHYFNDAKHRVKWKDHKRVANKLPTLRDFAKSVKVPISTIYDWLNKDHASFHKGFSDAFTCAREIRQDFLTQNALQGLYPPLTFKFVAVNLTDMRDTQEHELSGKDGKPIPVSIVDFAKINDSTE